MDCVLILFQLKLDTIKPDEEKLFLLSSWTESLKCMSDSSFLSKIMNYPKDLINAEIVDLMMPYLNYQ